MKEVKSIDVKLQKADKYYIIAMTSAVVGPILGGIGLGKESMLLVVLGGISVAIAVTSGFICSKFWERAH